MEFQAGPKKSGKNPNSLKFQTAARLGSGQTAVKEYVKNCV